MFVWMFMLAGTVAFQRRKKETARMKEIWNEMKRKDKDEVVGPAPKEERGNGDA